MLASLHNLSPGNEALFTGSSYRNTGIADGWWELLKDKITIFYPIENFSYNRREFVIKDCHGYILQFGRDILKQKSSLAKQEGLGKSVYIDWLG